MSYFKNVCLLKAPQAFDIPHPQDVSDLTEICYLGGMIENVVDNVTIPVDFYSKNAYDNFVNFLKKTPIDLVGISSMTGAFNNAVRLAQIAKNFDKYVVMGGYHPTALYGDVLKSSYVDAVIVGEGEATFKDFVTYGPSKEVAGLAYKENGGIFFTGYRPTIKDLDSIPHPLRRVRPMRFGEAGDDYSIDTVYTSRGCPWTCTFCANDTVNKKWRGRGPENVVEELSILHNPKRKKLIKIWDANFLTNIKRVERICDLMIERGITNFKIWTETRAGDIVRAEGIMDKLYKVGLRNVSLGIESPNEETLKLMKKKNTSDDISKAVDVLNKYKIKSQGYFIIGHYSETVEDTMRYPEYAEAIGLRQAIFMVMTPYPGTDIFKEYKEENKIKSFDWDLYNNFCTVVETRGMDFETLKKMQAYCYGRFWSRYSGLKRKGLLGIVIYIMSQLFHSYTLLRLNKSYTDDEIKNLIFESLRATFVKTDTISSNKKLPMFLRWFSPVTIRVTHSKGRNIDYTIWQQNGLRLISLKETSDTSSVKGPIIKMNTIIKLAKMLYPEKAITLSCKGEIIKNRPYEKTKGILSLIKEKDLLSTCLIIGHHVSTCISKGIISIILHARKKQSI